MKVLVAYYSETGNTEKIAKAIHSAIPSDNNLKKEIKKVQDIPNLSGYDLIFYGFPVQGHSVPIKAADLISKMDDDQYIAFFSTHGSLRGGILAKQAFEHALGLASRSKVLGHFGCRGKVDRNLLEKLIKNEQHKAWVEEASSAINNPDENDMIDAKNFALEMITKMKINLK